MGSSPILLKNSCNVRFTGLIPLDQVLLESTFLNQYLKILNGGSLPIMYYCGIQ